MSEPYTKEWYAELMDRTEPRYCEADLDRLRTENVELRRDLEIWRRNGGDILQRAEIDALQHDLDSYMKAANEYLAEIERLQAELKGALDELYESNQARHRDWLAQKDRR